MHKTTFVRYATLVFAFILSVNATVTTFFQSKFNTVLNEHMIGYLAGEHCQELSTSDVRCFTSAVKFFMPWVPRERITAELRGVEIATPTTPTTPITLPIMIALAVFASVKLGAEFGCGIVVAFFGLLRANEVIKVVGMDVIKRSAHCKATTIRLGKTKNNREESIQFGENSVAERALLFALAKNGHVPGRKLFGFRKYSELYKLVAEFNAAFRVNVHITPHSLRAGGATYYRMQNLTIDEISEIGRWSNVSTTRSYIDVVYALLPETVEAEKQVQPRELTALSPFLAPVS